MKTNLENYEERFVDYMEGLLNPSEMREVENFVAHHPELEDDFKLFMMSKLEPNPKVTYDHKEQLIQPASSKPKVIPLFVRIASAAAVVALLFGVGWRFLRPKQGPTPTENTLIANLPSIRTTKIQLTNAEQGLAESHYVEQLAHHSDWRKTQNKKQQEAKTPQNAKQHAPQNAKGNPSQGWEMEPLDLTHLEAKRLQRLPWNGHIEYCCVESDMIKEADWRMAQLSPYLDEGPMEYPSLATKSEDIVTDLGEYFFGNAHRITRSIYKQTAKSVLSAYYTADCYLNETKEKRGLGNE